jgi:hypothetical protein
MLAAWQLPPHATACAQFRAAKKLVLLRLVVVFTLTLTTERWRAGCAGRLRRSVGCWQPCNKAED